MSDTTKSKRGFRSGMIGGLIIGALVLSGTASAADTDIPRSKSFDFASNITANGAQLTYDGFKYQPTCTVTPTGIGYKAIASLYVSGPPTTSVSTYGVAQDFDAAGGVPVAGVTERPSSPYTEVTFSRSAGAARRVVDPWHVQASNGTSQLVFLRIIVAGGVNVPAGYSRCRIHATILASSTAGAVAA